MTHALVTGPIQGRIPHGDGFVDVTPDVVMVDSVEEAHALAESIELEHAVRGSHPLQAECANLDNPELHPHGIDDKLREQHQAAHKALNKKVGL
jgi:hypothetical protein